MPPDIFSADSIQSFYSLAKEIMTDLKGVKYKSARLRFQKYKELFEVVRRAHVSYIDIFIKLKQETMLGNLDEAKEKFFIARQEHAVERALAKFDAHTYLQVTEETDEKRYLGSVVWYFHYRDTLNKTWNNDYLADLEINTAISMGGDSAWDSASSAAWLKIKNVEDKFEINEIINEILNYINNRYTSIVRYYTIIEIKNL